MRVFLFDVADPDRALGGRYTLDTTLGVPLIGDEVFLRERDYQDVKKSYLAATVRRRRWIFSDQEPESAILQIWVQRHGT